MDGDQLLREQYDAILDMLEEMRQKCYSGGHLVAYVKGKGGQPVANPALAEWHKLMTERRKLARELGMAEDEEAGERPPLIEATKDGDRLEALRALTIVLAESIVDNNGRGLASLSREYRETTMALKELEDEVPADDRIGKLVAEGAARAHRLGLSVL